MSDSVKTQIKILRRYFLFNEIIYTLSDKGKHNLVFSLNGDIIIYNTRYTLMTNLFNFSLLCLPRFLLLVSIWTSPWSLVWNKDLEFWSPDLCSLFRTNPSWASPEWGSWTFWGNFWRSGGTRPPSDPHRTGPPLSWRWGESCGPVRDGVTNYIQDRKERNKKWKKRKKKNMVVDGEVTSGSSLFAVFLLMFSMLALEEPWQ